MARFLLAALVFSLLIIAGGGSDPANAAATPRTIPWDCSDWQAAAAVDDAEDARVSVILESLATNRGQTLYCAVDQSDTFTKAETWQAGRDRNERDDTVYQGQNGRFRGFLAAQEGYLTDGESGVTGISRARVFEFPEEPKKKRRRYTYKELTLSGVFQFGTPDFLPAGTADPVQSDAESSAGANLTSCVGVGGPCEAWFDDHFDNSAFYAAQHARSLCRPAGFPIVREKNIQVGSSLDLYFTDDLDARATHYQYKASYQRSYTITCLKRVRR